MLSVETNHKLSVLKYDEDVDSFILEGDILLLYKSEMGKLHMFNCMLRAAAIK